MSDFTGRTAFCQQLTQAGIAWQADAPLAPLTTFRIGGPAAVLCRPADAQQAVETLRLLQAAGVRYYCLGRGSNTLFADEGYDGAVVDFSALNAVRTEGCTLTAGAGASLADVCRTAQQAGLAGLEFAYGIPGSVGGAVFMNAGAYCGEMKDAVISVTACGSDGTVRTLDNAACCFAYRRSVFTGQGGMVLEASFRLTPDDPAAIAARMEDYTCRRASKQPLEWPSAGSTFKRPQGAFAAALIDECGLKGMAVGGAAVSEKHAGFVINRGGATCRDVVELTDRISAIVLEKTGFALEREIRVVR